MEYFQFVKDYEYKNLSWSTLKQDPRHHKDRLQHFRDLIQLVKDFDHPINYQTLMKSEHLDWH